MFARGVVLQVSVALIVVSASYGEYFKDGSLLQRLLESYDNNKAPLPVQPGGSVLVQMSLQDVFIQELSTCEMSLKASFILRQEWQDERLEYSTNGTGGADQLLVPGGNHYALWIPEISFAEGTITKIQSDLFNGDRVFISPDGTVTKTTRLESITPCPMALGNFPFDNQFCSLYFEDAYARQTKGAPTIKWKPSDSLYVASSQLEQFRLVSQEVRNYVLSYTSGDYANVEVQFSFARDCGYNVIKYLLPSLLILTTTWISPWISRSLVATRSLISLSSFLSITIIFTFADFGFGGVSVVTAAHVFFYFSMVYTLFTFVVVTTASMLHSYEINRQSADQIVGGSDGMKGKIASTMDWVCRIACPLLLVIFLICYLIII